MHIRNLEHAQELLKTYVPVVSQVTGKDMTIERSLPLFRALGNPHKRLKVIHIAGTSGKTSTSYYIASLLQKTGVKVGLTVSPHIDKVTERIQINGSPISDEKFCHYLSECLEKIVHLTELPSFFELLMALAFYVFHKEGVDYAVVETGMGGLHDTSNIADSPDKVCVITDIGYDHMNILGNTIAEIAAQKAGIIHKGNVAYLYKQEHDVMAAIRKRCEDVDADYVTVAEEYTTSTLVDFQKRNFNLAAKVVDEVIQRDSLKNITKQQAIDAQHTYIPGRMEVATLNGKTVIMDGAHNSQKMGQFVRSYQDIYSDKKATIVLALKEGKEYKDVIKILAPIANKFILTTFKVTQDLPSISMNTSVLKEEVERYKIKCDVIAEIKNAYEAALSDSGIVVVTGSFYLLAQLRAAVDLTHGY